MQTILGANGAIARELSGQLAGSTERIRQVSRNPRPINRSELGNTPTAYNQGWHALTSRERITGEALVRFACESVGRKCSLQRVPKIGVRFLGLFVPVLKEFIEMMYQFEEDYFLDSSKSENAFNLKATSYLHGMERVIKAGLPVKEPLVPASL